MRFFPASILAISVMTHVVTGEVFTDEVIKIGDTNCTCSLVFTVRNDRVDRRQSRVSCQEDCVGISGLIQLTSKDTGNMYQFKVRAKKGKSVLIRPRITVNIQDNGLFEGDMLLTIDQLQKLNESLISGSMEGFKTMKSHKNAKVDINTRWPDKTLVYQLNLDPTNNALVRNTLDQLQRKLEKNQGRDSCVKFKESNSGPRVKVADRGKCSSGVGYLGSRRLSLASGCMDTGIIEHEFLHALGIFHTQSRWDRHQYVDIIWDNIESEDAKKNFKQYDSSMVTHYNLPYDYKSVMHYGSNYFGIKDPITNIRKTTIKTNDTSKQGLIGQRIGVSNLDIELVRRMYDCDCPYTDTPTYTSFCEDWARVGLCKGVYVDWMTTNCKKTCLCKPADCPYTDTRTDCPNRASKEECINNKDFMATNCPKSCLCS